MNILAPPRLGNIKITLAAIPQAILPWIAEKHVQYLDDRIHKIGPLTEYLKNCNRWRKNEMNL
jgi:hypothetical protein